MDAAALNYTLRQPLGVVGLISPWNLPLYLLSWKIAPAIAAGNTCVAKPSELTPLTANRLAELSLEAGIPPGVINIVHGYGSKAGRALTCHDDVAAISFTGGTVTGAAVAANAAPRFKKLSLELGGKNPNVDLRRRRSRRRDRHVDPLQLLESGRDLPLRLAHLRRALRSTTNSSSASSRRRRSCASAIRSTTPPTSAR